MYDIVIGLSATEFKMVNFLLCKLHLSKNKTATVLCVKHF